LLGVWNDTLLIERIAARWSHDQDAVIEAADAAELGRGMKALGTRFARTRHAAAGRSGVIRTLVPRMDRRVLPSRDPPVVTIARSWLLRVGWLRWGPIAPAEVPG